MRRASLNQCEQLVAIVPTSDGDCGAPRLGRVDEANRSDSSSFRWLSDTVPSEERIELSSLRYASEVLLQTGR